MIRWERVGVTHAGAHAPVLRDVTLTVEEGELAVVTGPTGSGKSTLLGTVSGLVPHFTGGTLTGRVLVQGRDTREHRPRDLADVVGVVGQDPLSGFVAESVEDELAFTTEQLGVAPDVMRKRVEETIDLLGLQPLRGRPLTTLSSGEQQRVAIGAVLTAQPAVLVLDEPTSALDPAAAEDVLAVLARLVHDLGTTVLIAEHRLERVIQFADTLIEVGVDGAVTSGPPADMAVGMATAPPVVRLGRWAGWTPLPVSVRDARRRATSLRERLAAAHHSGLHSPSDFAAGRDRPSDQSAPAHVLRTAGLTVEHAGVRAVDGVDLHLRAGEVVALMGRNGAGKSSLLWALQGAGRRDGGTVAVTARDVRTADPASLDPARARELIGLVPQTASDLLYAATVAEECDHADRDADATPGHTMALLDRLAPDVPAGRHPRDLSEGQRLCLALAVQLVARPRVVLLDEPTRGLDYAAKDRLAEVLADLAATDHAVLVATHDVEFVATATQRTILMASGEVIADGATRDVVAGSPAYAPQVARILRPQPMLTLLDVQRALGDLARGDLP